MKPAYARLLQRIADVEARLKPQALQLMAWIDQATDIEALKARLLGNHLTNNPADRGRPIDWHIIRWAKEGEPGAMSPPRSDRPSPQRQSEVSEPWVDAGNLEGADVAEFVMPDPSAVRRVIVTVRNPSVDGSDPGEVAIGYYVVEGGTVSLTDAAGMPMGKSATAKPGEEHRVAGRLLRTSLKPTDGFNRHIAYPPISIA